MERPEGTNATLLMIYVDMGYVSMYRCTIIAGIKEIMM